tara:strand:+ start:23412 stop:25283 length:1872 start_codon:yes stop_codon:yes gene_type:complete
MKKMNLLERLLIEGRKQNVVKRFPYLEEKHGQYGGFNLLELFMSDDPSGNHKYLEWMAVRFDQGLQKKLDTYGDTLDAAQLEKVRSRVIKAALDQRRDRETDSGRNVDINRNIEDLFYSYGYDRDYPSAVGIRFLAHAFHAVLPYLSGLGLNKDINTYTLESLAEAIPQAARTKELKDSEKDIKLAAKKGAKIIWESKNPSMAVIRPKTMEASCLFGRGTQWCISATQSRNYFNDPEYTTREYYFFIFKKLYPFVNIYPQYQKIAVVIYQGEIEELYDVQDDTLELATLDEMWQAYFKETSYRKSLEKVLELCIEDSTEDPATRGINEEDAWDIIGEHPLGESGQITSIRVMEDPIQNEDGEYGVELETDIIIPFKLNPNLARKEELWFDQAYSRATAKYGTSSVSKGWPPTNIGPSGRRRVQIDQADVDISNKKMIAQNAFKTKIVDGIAEIVKEELDDRRGGWWMNSIILKGVTWDDTNFLDRYYDDDETGFKMPDITISLHFETASGITAFDKRELIQGLDELLKTEKDILETYDLDQAGGGNIHDIFEAAFEERLTSAGIAREYGFGTAQRELPMKGAYDSVFRTSKTNPAMIGGKVEGGDAMYFDIANPENTYGSYGK